MVQFTAIALQSPSGEILSVRAHAVHMSAEGIEAYLGGYACPPSGTCVSMWPIDLYSDIGDVSDWAAVRRYRLDGQTWTEMPVRAP
jgi:hypothetical protein